MVRTQSPYPELGGVLLQLVESPRAEGVGADHSYLPALALPVVRKFCDRGRLSRTLCWLCVATKHKKNNTAEIRPPPAAAARNVSWGRSQVCQALYVHRYKYGRTGIMTRSVVSRQAQEGRGGRGGTHIGSV